MSIFPNRKIFAIPAVIALMALAAPTPVQAQDDSWVSSMFSTATVALAGGDYAWWADLSQPAPALLAEYYPYEGGVAQDVPANPDPESPWAIYLYNASLLKVTFEWGDGYSDEFLSDVTEQEAQNYPGRLWCDNSANLEAPSGGFGGNCSIEARHTYTTQGVKTITVTASQGGQDSPYTFEQLVIDLSAGGSLSGKGTLLGREGGMYDQDFASLLDTDPKKRVTFNITAKRRSGTTATQASVLVTAPGMLPDYPPSAAVTGMTFKGSAALNPLYVMKTRSGIEAILEKVEGRVTNTLNGNPGHDAGGARASIQVNVQKGFPTLMRIFISNTSAGYTYLDTGWQPASMYQLDPTHDVLLSGSVRVG